MKIHNITRQNFLAQEVEIAQNPFSRMKGLLGRKSLPKGQALIIRPCNQVHMFFMNFAIDVVFLNKENIIVGLVNSLEPNRVSPLYLKAHSAVELPPGTILATSTQIKDEIELV